MRRTDKATATQCDHQQDSRGLGRNLGVRGTLNSWASGFAPPGERAGVSVLIGCA